LSKDLYISTQSGRRRAVSYTIGQSIQTPSDDRVAAGAGIRYGHDLDVRFPTATVLPGRQVNPLAGSAALSFNLYRRAFLFSATVATDRYKGQAETTRFGSLSVTYNR